MTPAIFFENFAFLADAPNGVQKLRELILQLAVRGKLVSQDSTDEPASKLLERIKVEKAKLVKEKKIRNSEMLSQIDEAEKPFSLPKGWRWTRLGTLGFTQTGTTPSTTNPDYFGNDYPFVKPADISEKGVRYTGEGLSSKGIEKGRLIPAYSVLMVCIGGSISKVNFIDRDCSCNQQINTITPYYGTDCRLLTYFMASPFFKNQVLENAPSTTLPILSKGKWEVLLVPLPPLAEQHRIVAKVDQLMALCNELEARQQKSQKRLLRLNNSALDGLTSAYEAAEFTTAWQFVRDSFDLLYTTPETIAKLRQSILQLAVQGRLVAQDPTEEPVAKLMDKIRVEKARLIKEKLIRKSDPLPPVAADEVPYQLPQGWERVRLGEVSTKITDGEHITPRRASSGYYLLSARNVTNRGILLNDVDYVDGAEFDRIRKRCDPNKGDILISCSGSIGRVSIVDEDNKYVMVRSAAMVRLPIDISHSYAALCLQSPYLQNQMAVKSKATAQSNLFLGKISSLILPLPPISEQRRIVAKVDYLMTICDKLESMLTKAQTKAGKLATSSVQGLLAA